MSLPWAHHLICGAPLVRDYRFTIWENPMWEEDSGKQWLVEGSDETAVTRWFAEFNDYHSVWTRDYRNGTSVGRRLRTPAERAAYAPLVQPKLTHRVFLCVVASHKSHGRAGPGEPPNGCYFYPKDRTSRAECEQIIAELKRYLEQLPAAT